ncbi:uncharacterized protein LOC103579268 [Microplitis demolitor]|uniref:uncharacterized protein LOC103579268 n=1 Tax=Microplitis demolitor TaxID=69319 RepID=UPI0006D4E8C4|nr:uncharacterized protein LOC103579268 [Microplitis demolitor]
MDKPECNTGYCDLNKLNAKSDYNSNDDSNCEDDNASVNQKDDAKKRKKRKILRSRHYNKHQDESNYYREQLLLFLPFRDEKTEIENCSENRKNIYGNNLDLIVTNRSLIYQMEKRYLSDIFKEKEAEDDDYNDEHNDENKNFTLKENQPDDTVDIFADNKNSNEQQLQITIHCLHAQKIGKQIRLMISGQAGTGKSFLINLLYQVIPDYYTKKISCTDIESAHAILAAPYGKAAYLIHDVTVHSCFCLPRDNMSRNIAALSSSVVTSLRFEMRNVKVVIIDEVSMIGRNRFNQIDTRLQQITGNNSPFFGLSIIFVGVLRQLPPIMDKPIYYTAFHYFRDKKLQWNKQHPDQPFKPNIADPTYRVASTNISEETTQAATTGQNAEQLRRFSPFR